MGGCRVDGSPCPRMRFPQKQSHVWWGKELGRCLCAVAECGTVRQKEKERKRERERESMRDEEDERERERERESVLLF